MYSNLFVVSVKIIETTFISKIASIYIRIKVKSLKSNRNIQKQKAHNKANFDRYIKPYDVTIKYLSNNFISFFVSVW